MSYLLSILAGAFVAVMISINGILTNVVGTQSAAILFSSIALFLAATISSGRKPKKRIKAPLWMYFGGIFNVITIWLNNLAFGKITVSALLALSLLGQVVVSAVVDHFALFGATEQKMDRFKIIGFIIISIGLIVLTFPLEGEGVFAVVITLITGFMVVFTRILNAELAKVKNLQISVFWNFLVGTIGIIILSKTLYQTPIIDTYLSLSKINPWLLTGGIFAVASILITNYISPHIASYYLTLFLFIGQIFTGLLIDIALEGSFHVRNFIGGMLVLAGLYFNLYFDNIKKNEEKS